MFSNTVNKNIGLAIVKVSTNMDQTLTHLLRSESKAQMTAF